MKTNRHHFEFHSSPIYEMNTTYDQVHFLIVVGLLHLLIFAYMRELFGIPLEISWLALFLVLLAFIDQSFWLLQLSISNVPRITTSMLAFQVPYLVYLHIGGKPLDIGRSDLSPKNHSWHSHEMSWLIDPCDGLILMSNLKSFFKSFSFYQMISNCY